MNLFNSFDKKIKDVKNKHLFWFNFPKKEKIPQKKEIENTEKILNLKFSKEYKYFLIHYSAGYFVFSKIYSINSNSHVNIINKNKHHSNHKYLLFSENGCGDFYGFKIEKKQCLAEIYFYNHKNDIWYISKYRNFFEFIYGISLK